MTQKVFLIGMFRSGTTLLSRMMSSHPNIHIISDPFLYVFKSLNADVFNKNQISADISHPTSDWFNDPHLNLLNEIYNADLNYSLSPNSWEKLQTEIKLWKTDQHPKLCERLSEVEASTYKDLLDQLLKLSKNIYGDDETLVAGTKFSWAEEYALPLLRSYPNCKIIFITRDIRAVVSSINQKTLTSDEKRPLLFLIRHWRKSIRFQAETIKHSIAKNRTLQIKYEDLIGSPVDISKKICALLNLDFNPNMIDPSCFIEDGTQKRWKKNSSFELQSNEIIQPKFDTSALNRWKAVLPSNVHSILNTLCHSELKLMDYHADTLLNMDELSSIFPEDNGKENADWITKSPNYKELNQQEILNQELELEYKRLSLIHDGGPSQIRAINNLIGSESYRRLLSSGQSIFTNS